MRLLLTNDDGIESPGLQALVQVLGADHHVIVVAPDGERSGSGHAFTRNRPMRFQEVRLPGAQVAYALDGTPVDCVKVGMFFFEAKADWVISGINVGANVGLDAFYSGTIGAACEGALQGYRGVAFSLDLRDKNGSVNLKSAMGAAAVLCKRVFDQIVDRQPTSSCLNVNIPHHPLSQIKGICSAGQASQRYIPYYEAKPMENGDNVLIRSDLTIVPDQTEGLDYHCLKQGWITVTPLSLNRTDPALLQELSRWTWRP